jgi:cytochrome b561
MTLSLPADGAFAEPAPALAPARYDRISIVFHWATLLLIGVMFWSAWAREGVQDAAAAARLLTIHRSVGVSIWLVTMLRILWRILFAATPPLPPAIPTTHYVAARLNQLGLYALLMLQPLTGLLQTVWRGKPFGLFGATIPRLVGPDKDLSHLFRNVHEASATILLVLIGLHALAALFHGFVRRDGVMRAMLPFAPGASSATEGATE